MSIHRVFPPARVRRFFPCILAGLLILAPAALHAAIERTVVKTFAAQHGGTLTVQTDSGPIRVETAEGSAVKVEIREKIDATSDAAADALLKDLTLTFTSTGGNVTVQARHARDTGGFWSHLFNGGEAVQLDFVVTVPARYNVNLTTAGGRIEVGNLTGEARADTSGGGLEFGAITGDIHGRTSGGGIRIKSCTGRTDVATSGGGIAAGVLQGPARLRTSGGSITVRQAENTVDAGTSGGGISVAFTGPLKGDCSLDTSAGGIHVTVDRDAAFNLRADTSAGILQCALPVGPGSGRPHRDHLEGPVNGGGPLLRLDTSAGGIHITAAN